MPSTAPWNTGQARTVATRIGGIPGTAAASMSMPNRALPSTLPGMSLRGMDLPIKLNSAGAFNRGLAGGGRVAAAAAKSAYAASRPLAGCEMRLAANASSSGGTSHSAAAARASISRAAAPATRMACVPVARRLKLPPVTCKSIAWVSFRKPPSTVSTSTAGMFISPSRKPLPKA